MGDEARPNHPNLDRQSAVELNKAASRHLRGEIVDELSLETLGFTKQTVQILKFHGIYQQGDRDARKQGAIETGCMVRVGIPGGALTPEQYLALDELADEAGDGGLRVTTRQDVQVHRVRKSDLRGLMQALERNVLTTLAACGDVVRNVVCCPAPCTGGERAEVLAQARRLSKRFKPRTTAYYEIWIDGEKAFEAQPEEEPLYGETYLPRKFKIGFAMPGDNCTDVYANDVGLVPVCGPGGVEGYTVLAGGGLGMSPGAKATHPRLADPLGTVTAEQAGDVVEAIITIHRDFGNRSDRKFARLKYVLEEWGVERFRGELERRVGYPLAPAEPLVWASGGDHLGWRLQAGGGWFLGVHVLSGRIRDNMREALREAVTRFGAGVRLTPQQNVLLTDIPGERRGEVEETLRRYGIRQSAELPPVVQSALACPALPTCGLAITEAERVLPEMLSAILAQLEEAGIGDEGVTVRVTGCPNGCARPYTAEIGIVGQSVDLYKIYLGGSRLGTRLGALFRENVKRDAIASVLAPVFAMYRERRSEGETFGDFCHRAGMEELANADADRAVRVAGR